jgi:hypothetical protein
MSVSLPLVRTVVLGETLPILVLTRRKSDESAVSDDQPLCFDRSRSRSVYVDPNRGLLGHLFHLFLPRCCHCSPSLGFCERYVSSVPGARLSKANGVYA